MDGRHYDSKAIAGVAHRFTAPDAVPLAAADFSGGRSTVKRTLEQLGFVVSQAEGFGGESVNLEAGRTYSWDELAGAFAFSPRLFSVGGRDAVEAGAQRNVVDHSSWRCAVVRL
jgi:hypothetical protein